MQRGHVKQLRVAVSRQYGQRSDFRSPGHADAAAGGDACGLPGLIGIERRSTPRPCLPANASSHFPRFRPLEGFVRRPPECLAPSVRGRHPKPFTRADLPRVSWRTTIVSSKSDHCNKPNSQHFLSLWKQAICVEWATVAEIPLDQWKCPGLHSYSSAYFMHS